MSNFELADIVKQRMETLPEAEREALLSHVFGEEEEETPAIARQEDLGEVESLLTPEDQEALNDNEQTPENPADEGQTLQARDNPPLT